MIALLVFYSVLVDMNSIATSGSESICTNRVIVTVNIDDINHIVIVMIIILIVLSYY
jgi:hypothetical protein